MLGLCLFLTLPAVVGFVMRRIARIRPYGMDYAWRTIGSARGAHVDPRRAYPALMTAANPTTIQEARSLENLRTTIVVPLRPVASVPAQAPTTRRALEQLHQHRDELIAQTPVMIAS